MSYPFVQAYHDLGVAKGPRLAMCWHMAEGGGTVGFLSRPNTNGVSVHFVIEYSGNIVQMLRLDHMHSSIRTSAIRATDDPPYTYQGEIVHYGRTTALRALGAWADIAHGTLGPNHATVGVEVEGFAADGPNAMQTASIGRLAAYLGLPANLAHRDFASYKGCPGHRFPWPSTGGHGPRKDDDVPGMRLTDVQALKGRATIKTAGIVWRVVTGEQIQVGTGAAWDVVGSARYNHDAAEPQGDLGYEIRAGADSELHIVAQSRCTFTPDSTGDCTDEIAADRATAHIVWGTP